MTVEMRRKHYTLLLLAACFLLTVTWYFNQNLPEEDGHEAAAINVETFERPPPPPPLPTAPLQPQCTPVKNLSFLKLHRCGSGSFHNVLVRFAINHNAFVALANCANYMVFPLQVSPELLYPTPQHPNFTGYNMFIDHQLFNKTAVERILPDGDVMFITQIRHPYREAYSVYEHFWAGRPHVDYDLFLSDPPRYETPVNILWPCRQTKNYSISRNVMSLELGYTEQDNLDQSVFQRYLQKLDHELHHVSILEERPQSLILLKHKLCWEFKDLLQLRLHTRHSAEEHPMEKQRQHRNWSPLDYYLYEFFLRKHKESVAKQPPWFHDEVAEFERVEERFAGFCAQICTVFSGIPTDDTHRIREALAVHIDFPGTRFYKTFSMSYLDCAMLQLGELIVKKALKFHMNPGLCGSDPNHARYLGISCDVANHVIPGLTARDINDLLDPQRCRLLSYII